MIRHFTGMVQTAVAIVRWNRPRSQRSALVHSSPTAALSVSETKGGLMSSVQIPEKALPWPLVGRRDILISMYPESRPLRYVRVRDSEFCDGRRESRRKSKLLRAVMFPRRFRTSRSKGLIEHEHIFWALLHMQV